MKEGIQKIGKSFDGQPIYAFRYRGDPNGQTHLGLMAQEVERKHPGAVAHLGDLKMVDYAEARRKAATKGHFARGGRTLGDLHYHELSRDEVAHLDEVEDRHAMTFGNLALARRASGGVVGPYVDADGYVPTSQGLAPAHPLAAQLPSPTQPTSPIPSFTQFQQAGQGLGASLRASGTPLALSAMRRRSFRPPMSSVSAPAAARSPASAGQGCAAAMMPVVWSDPMTCCSTQMLSGRPMPRCSPALAQPSLSLPLLRLRKASRPPPSLSPLRLLRKASAPPRTTTSRASPWLPRPS